MKIGVCEMQGWRRTMEDAAIVLPNFDKKEIINDSYCIDGVPCCWSGQCDRIN